jgi:hypothetical protein
MNAAFPHRGHRSGRAPGGSCDGNHGTFAGIPPMIHRFRVRASPATGKGRNGRSRRH